MNPKDKLILIQKFSGLTQEELARRLGVTFAALNRWINGKAAPRKKAVDKINALYLEYSGEKSIPESTLAAKNNLVFSKQKKHKHIISEILENPDIYDEFILSLTYNSNRIEGSSLSENDTAAILFENASLPDKNLVEQLEAKNHQAALEYLFQYIKTAGPINEELILKLHGILMNAVRPDAGIYRKHAVRIRGSYIPTANYLKVPHIMKELIKKIQKNRADALSAIASVHSRFEQTHPFSDGNGRTGRLLMHAMALKINLPPPVIKQEKKREYINYLNKSQTAGDLSLLEDFISDAILESYKIVERNV